MLRKSYTGFIIWMVLFTVVCVGAAFLPVENQELLARIVMAFVNLMLVILMLLMYKTEKVYWLNGISYEAAVEAGSDRRKAYALKHVKLFGIFTAAAFLFSLVAQLLGWNSMIDLIFITLGIVTCAIYSNRYKL